LSLSVGGKIARGNKKLHHLVINVCDSTWEFIVLNDFIPIFAFIYKLFYMAQEIFAGEIRPKKLRCNFSHFCLSRQAATLHNGATACLHQAKPGRGGLSQPLGG
jgi:hypothetical protein